MADATDNARTAAAVILETLVMLMTGTPVLWKALQHASHE
jgi:hypothetical protein